MEIYEFPGAVGFDVAERDQALKRAGKEQWPLSS